MLTRKHLHFFARRLIRDNAACRNRVNRLLAHETWSSNRLQEYQTVMLARTLKAASNAIPAYKELNLPRTSENLIEAFQEKIPVTQKEELLEHRDFYYPNRGHPFPWTIRGKTSGTTGTPLDIFRSLDSILWENAFLKRHWDWCGFKDGMPRATMRGDAVIPIEQKKPPFWLYNPFNNQLFISSRHLKREYMGYIIEALQKFRPHLIQAYPSTAFSLANYLDHENLNLPIPYVFTGSEMLYPHQRDLIEARIGKVMDFYGMAERVAFASECEHGNLHVNTDYSFTEIVDESGRPTEGEGFIVGTTFHNLVMPLIRYRLSDRSRWRKGDCPCGRPYPMIEPIMGKFEDVIFGSDGSPISPSLVTFAFKGVHNVACSQVAQITPGTWEIRIEPMPTYSEQDGMQIVRNIHLLVDPTINVHLRVVQEIPRTTAGKYRWIVNEM